MKLTRDQVKHVSKLANLPLGDQEVDRFEEQLSETLDYVESLEEVDTKNVSPTSQVTGLQNIFREDEVKPSLTQEEALKNAKATYKGFIKVKAVLEE